MSCASFALPELEFLSECGQQLLISGQAVPVDATFLQHGNGDLVVFHHVAQIVPLQVLGVEGEAVQIKDESSHVRAVQSSWKVTIVKGVWINGRLGGVRTIGCIGWGGGRVGVMREEGISGGSGVGGVKGRKAGSG